MTSKAIENIAKIVLVLLVVIAGYWLFRIIQDPIVAKRRQQKRKDMVIERLQEARKAQKAYQEMKGHYTPHWDSLLYMLKKDTFTMVRTYGDPNDTTIDLERDTSYMPVRDSLLPPDLPADSIAYAPFTGKRFEMGADTIRERGVDVHVFEIKDVKSIDGKTLKVGSLKEGTTSGNW